MCSVLMGTPEINEFERLVHAYLAGQVTWTCSFPHTEKAAITRQLFAERGDRVWPINLKPDPTADRSPSRSQRRIGSADKIHAHPEDLQLVSLWRRDASRGRTGFVP